MDVTNRIILAFNKFYSSFLKDLKATNDEVKATIRKNYKVIDKLSKEYLEYFNEEFGSTFNKFVSMSIEDLSKDTDIIDRKVVKDVSIKQVLESVDSESDLSVFWNYVFILTLLNSLYKETEESVEVIFKSVIDILGKIQRSEDIQSALDDIIDDDIRALILKIKPIEKIVPGVQGIPGMEDPLKAFGQQDNLICNLAKEISNEIDVSNIKLDNPEDIFKMMDFSSSNNIVGDIIKKVSGKIHDKINTGELKQEELFGEAMSMMQMMNMGGAGGQAGGLGNLFNNPMMSEMMKSMKKGKAVPRQDVMKKASARDRLKAKLEERRKQQTE